MRIDESAVRGLAAGPDFIGLQAREHAGRRIMEMNSVTERQRPEIAFIVFRPSESRVDRHSANGANGVLMMAANAAVLVTLTFNQKLGAELF